MSGSFARVPSASAERSTGDHVVSRPDSPAERQAHAAADVVARGGSVSGWSFAQVPLTAPVQREETAGEPSGQKSDEEKLKEAAAKTGEAILKTPAAEKLKEKILDHPDVRAVKDAVTSPVGIGVGVAAGLGGVAALFATGNELPFQPPTIPLDGIRPGLSADVRYEGPVNAPTHVGLTLTYQEQVEPGAEGPSRRERSRAETARMAAELARFREGLKTPEEKARDEAFMVWYLSRNLPGIGRPLVPLDGGAIRATEPPRPAEERTPPDPATGDAGAWSISPDAEPRRPVQREPDTVAAETGPVPDTTRVSTVTAAGGRALDTGVRRSMQARFGYDFSAVRIHDDAGAAAAARDLHARAFTVGHHIAFSPGAYDPDSPQGRHTLAHELAHVIQQDRTRSDGSRLAQRDPPRGGSAPAPAPPSLPTTLADLQADERVRLQVVTTTPIDPQGIGGMFDTEGARVTLPLPNNTTVAVHTSATSTNPDFAHGMRNLVATLVGHGVDPDPLPPNTTSHIRLDLSTWGGQNGVYRFTHVTRAATAGAPASARVLVEFLGTVATPTRSAPAAAPAQGRPQLASGDAAGAAPSTPTDPMAAYDLHHEGYGGDELQALRAAVAIVPPAHLQMIRGLRFRRVPGVDPNDPEVGGRYSSRDHTIVMYDPAFAPARNLSFRARPGSGPPTGDVTSYASRTILHEIGHAVDLAASRRAYAAYSAASDAVQALSRRYPDPDNPGRYRWENAAQEADIRATLRAQWDAQAAMLATHSRSGTRTVLADDGDFEDVVGTDAAGSAFRRAAERDGIAVSAYGQTDWQEAYAEAYALFLAEPETLRLLRPNVFAHLRDTLAADTAAAGSTAAPARGGAR